MYMYNSLLTKSQFLKPGAKVSCHLWQPMWVLPPVHQTLCYSVICAAEVLKHSPSNLQITLAMYIMFNEVEPVVELHTF